MNSRSWLVLGIVLALIVAKVKGWTVNISLPYLESVTKYSLYKSGETLITLQWIYDYVGGELFTYGGLILTYRFALFVFLLYAFKDIQVVNLSRPLLVIFSLGIMGGISILVLSKLASFFGVYGFGLGLLILLWIVFKLPIREREKSDLYAKG